MLQFVSAISNCGKIRSSRRSDRGEVSPRITISGFVLPTGSIRTIVADDAGHIVAALLGHLACYGWITLVSARKVKLAAMTGAGIGLLSVFPAIALVGGAPEASHSIARHVVMVVGSDKSFCSGVVIARDLILTAAQCIHPATKYGIIGFDAPKTLKNVASTIVHPDWDPTAVLRHRVSADVALLKLAARLPPAYVPVALADPKVVTVGFQVTVAGYGQAIAGNLKTGGTLRAVDLVVTGNSGSLQIRLVDPNTKGDVAGLGSCMGDSGGPVLEASDGRLTVLGLMSWATGPALSTGCGGLTGVTPIVRYRDWIIKTAAAIGSALSPMGPAKPSEDGPGVGMREGR